MSRIPLLMVFLILAQQALGQLDLSESYYRKLIVPDHMTFRVQVPTLEIDTLIMEKSSKLIFLYSTNINVGHAVIGKNCTWDARGEEHSGDGRHLYITMNLARLGRLTIDTRGGIGAPGRNGEPGAPGTDGSTFGSSAGNGGQGGPGGPGGKGGDGGNLTLLYRSSFTPNFKRGKKNSLVLRNEGGHGGRGGQGGPGGRGGAPVVRQYEGTKGPVKETNGVWGSQGPNGPIGFEGAKGKDGILNVARIP